MTTAVGRPGSLAVTMFAGQMIAGGSAPLIVKVAVLVRLPHGPVTITDTLCAPSVKLAVPNVEVDPLDPMALPSIRHS